jgi:hypothetical protein
MKVRDLIKLLETQDPNTQVVISNQDLLGTYREPYTAGRTIFVEDCGTYWRDVTDEERNYDLGGMIL